MKKFIMKVEIFVENNADEDILVQTYGDYIRQMGMHTRAKHVLATMSNERKQIVGTAKYKDGSFSCDIC